MAAAHQHAARPKSEGGYDGKYRALVLCPDHLVGKWCREIKETIPDAGVVRFGPQGEPKVSKKRRSKAESERTDERPTPARPSRDTLSLMDANFGRTYIKHVAAVTAAGRSPNTQCPPAPTLRDAASHPEAPRRCRCSGATPMEEARGSRVLRPGQEPGEVVVRLGWHDRPEARPSPRREQQKHRRGSRGGEGRERSDEAGSELQPDHQAHSRAGTLLPTMRADRPRQAGYTTGLARTLGIPGNLCRLRPGVILGIQVSVSQLTSR